MCGGGLLGKKWNPLATVFAPSGSLALTGTFLHNARLDREKKNKQKRIDANARELANAENESQDVANMELAAARRRRRLSSLLVGGRSVLGAASGRGAPGGSGTLSGGGTGYSGGGSVMAGGAAREPRRSYGGALP